MAITKVMHMSADFENVINSHLENSLNYILQEKKLGEEHLCAGINCMVSGAYGQMMETKEMFGKTGGRQGYHFVISLKPGEGTPQEMYEFAMKFAERALHNEYEAVVAVHTDKNRIHAHIILNSVNMVTGHKFQYRNGDWKRIYQPITNELCEEYGYFIVPAEYSKEPANMPRDDYERNRRFRDFIREDCECLLALSEDTKHFIWLLRELGYEVKEGMHIAVKVPGMKRFARLETIDRRYARENLERSILDAQRREASFPVRTFNTDYYRSRAKTPYQKRFYYQIRGIRVSEKYRFGYKAAKYYKDILWLQKWQEEYLFLCDNHIRSFEDLADYRLKAETELDQIKKEQAGIYKRNAALKRKCTTPEGLREYQAEHLRNGKRLAELKERARELRKGKGIVEHHMARSINEYLERIGRTFREENLVIDPTVADVPEYALAVERLRAEMKRQEEQKRLEAERKKQGQFQKLYKEMQEKGQRLHKKALDFPYDYEYKWEYIDYLDKRMFAPIEQFTIGEMSEPFLTYGEFEELKEQEKAEQRKLEEVERKKERDKIYSAWIEEYNKRYMEALENDYFSKWFLEYSTYLDAERERARTEYSTGQLRRPVLSYREFAEKKEMEMKKEKESLASLEKVSELERWVTVPTVPECRQMNGESRNSHMERIVTRQDYERMTDKEKAEWIGISKNDMNGSINRFKEKMGQIGMRFDSIPEMTEKFLKVWGQASQSMKKELRG